MSSFHVDQKSLGQVHRRVKAWSSMLKYFCGACTIGNIEKNLTMGKQNEKYMRVYAHVCVGGSQKMVYGYVVGHKNDRTNV